MKYRYLIVALAIAGAAAMALRHGTAPAAQANAAKHVATKRRDVLRFEPGAPQLAEIRSGKPVLASLPLSEPLNARIAYDENVTARVSSPIAGRVVALPVDIGAHVAAGQRLALLDSPDLGAALADARKAAADRRRKDGALQRAKALFDAEVISRRELEDAQADWEQARAEDERARQRLANLHADPSASSEAFALTAPIAGMVMERNINPGVELSPGAATPLFVVSDPTRLWAMVDLPEHLLDKIHEGQQATLEVPGWEDKTFSATIERIAPTLDPNTRRVSVRLVVANTDGKLRPEMFARVRLPADDARALVRVPSAAVVTEGVNHFAFVETAPGEFEKRRVEVAMQDRDDVYITSGIGPNERVVQAGALLLASELAGQE